MIDRQLKDFGLPEVEARVLAVLLERSPLGASAIAKAVDRSRSTVYTVLASLTAKGLVSTTYTNETKQFMAVGPDALAQLMERDRRALDAKTRALEELRQALVVMPQGGLHVPRVQLFEGVEGLQRIYLSMLREARDGATMVVLRDEFIWRDEWAFSWEPEWQERVRRWKSERDMRTKLLVNPSALEQGKSAFYRTRYGLDVRYLPAAQAVDRFAFYVVGDTTAILSFETGNLIGMKIVNAHLAANFARVFEGLWTLAGRARKRAK